MSFSKIEQIFIELIQLSLGNRERLSCTPSEEEWTELYTLAEKQSLTGISFASIERLPKNQIPDMDTLMEWLGQTEYIKTRNNEVNSHCGELQSQLNEDGFRNCILKGQGVAELYGDTLCKLRNSGDIDVWVDGSREQVIEYVMKHKPAKEFDQKHIHYHCFDDTEVEAHWIPVKRCSPKLDRILGEYFEIERERQFSNIKDGLCFPTVDFQLVHQLLHVYGHYLYEGVGLRQMMDLYFAQMACLKDFPEKIKDTLQLFRKLGLMKFVAATQWVQGAVFGLSCEGMICEPDYKEGKQLLEEIMIGGNFGQYDERNHVSGESFVGRFFRRWKRKFRMIRFDPLGTILMPYERIKLEIWMRKVRRQYGV